MKCAPLTLGRTETEEMQVVIWEEAAEMLGNFYVAWEGDGEDLVVGKGLGILSPGLASSLSFWHVIWSRFVPVTSVPLFAYLEPFAQLQNTQVAVVVRTPMIY